MGRFQAGEIGAARRPVGNHPLDWRLQAACRFMPADLFFPVGTSGMAVEEVAVAKAVCAGCPVSLQCLQFAVETRQEFGVWGGMDEEERRERLRRARAGGVLN